MSKLSKLNQAVCDNQPDTIINLIQKNGINVDALVAPDGRWINTPLLVWAAQQGHSNLVNVLIQKGADVNAFSTALNLNRTALDAAIANDDPVMVETLLQVGANVNRIHFSVTILDELNMRYSNDPQIREKRKHIDEIKAILVAHGAKTYKEHPDRQLIEHQALIKKEEYNERSRKGKFFMDALQGNLDEVKRKLAEEPSLLNYTKTDLLGLAAFCARESENIILGYGSGVEGKSHRHMNALFCALISTHDTKDVLQHLINNDADLSIFYDNNENKPVVLSALCNFTKDGLVVKVRDEMRDKVNLFMNALEDKGLAQNQCKRLYTVLTKMMSENGYKMSISIPMASYHKRDDGHSRVYSKLFCQSRAMLNGERMLFANTRAWFRGEGDLFADTKALLSGKRELFANTKAFFKSLKKDDDEGLSEIAENKPKM